MPTAQHEGRQAGPADGEYRLYRDLAGWWPLISPPGQYAQEAEYLAAVLDTRARVPVREVLDLGSGGGHVAVHLKDRFSLTLVDRSADMLAVSRRLVPQCRHRQGDMRSVRLGRVFDAVLVHDAIDYVTNLADLARVIGTAFAHCRPGGIAVFVPDYVKDGFAELTGSGGGGPDADGRLARFTEHTWDPDPGDDWVQADYEFSLCSADGSVAVIRETHRLGAFGRVDWLRLLAAGGFAPAAELGGPAAAGTRPEHLFAGHRPVKADPTATRS
ncbi:MAG: class I SAM-dependent methyltransferase [Streptosporangiaceae bacterium]